MDDIIITVEPFRPFPRDAFASPMWLTMWVGVLVTLTSAIAAVGGAL